MADWANETAYSLYVKNQRLGGDYNEKIERVAAALRQARRDALEEAKKEAKDYGTLHGYYISERIDALKEKQP